MLGHQGPGVAGARGVRSPPAPPRWARYLPAAVVGAVYLSMALCYSLMTKAWEANDELDHATYIEFIVRHGYLPRISAANGHESHQPPLYYVLAALWQKLLGIPAFTPSARPNPSLGAQAASTNAFLELLHNYTPLEHRHAVYLHELRLISVLFGLATVLLAYGCGRLLFARKPPAVALGLTVALWPKLLVVDSVVTNDSLLVTLCAAALYLFLLSEKARREGRLGRRRALMAGLGLTLGLALITKENSGPLVALLLALSAVPVFGRRAAPRSSQVPGPAPGSRPARRYLADVALASACLLATALWWFVRNRVLYGQFLASRVTSAYLKAWLPPLIEPVPWTDLHRFLVFVPQNLYRSTWYDGGWNQFVLPKWLEAPVWILAALCVISAALALAHRRPGFALGPSASRLGLAAVAGSVPAGIAAVMIIAQTTYQAEGRVAFAGLVGFAALLVMGTDLGRRRQWWPGLAVFCWPVVLLGLNAYIFSTYLVPLRGL